MSPLKLSRRDVLDLETISNLRLVGSKPHLPFVAPSYDAAKIGVELGSDGSLFLRLVALGEGDIVCRGLRPWDGVQQVVDIYNPE